MVVKKLMKIQFALPALFVVCNLHRTNWGLDQLHLCNSGPIFRAYLYGSIEVCLAWNSWNPTVSFSLSNAGWVRWLWSHCSFLEEHKASHYQDMIRLVISTVFIACFLLCWGMFLPREYRLGEHHGFNWDIKGCSTIMQERFSILCVDNSMTISIGGLSRGMIES